MKFLPSLATAVFFLCASCATIRQSPKYGLTDGNYHARLPDGTHTHVQVVAEEDTVRMFLDRTGDRAIILNPATTHSLPALTYRLRSTSFDVDVLSFLFKYRPPVAGFPRQLNTSILNGALYLGYRTDIYKAGFTTRRGGKLSPRMQHYGFSFGVFTGIGATRVDPWVTQNVLNIEYDGVVNPSGIAAIIGFDKLSFSLAAGVDHLLDRNRKWWIYQGKPWFGLGVGLNLN